MRFLQENYELYILNKFLRSRTSIAALLPDPVKALLEALCCHAFPSHFSGLKGLIKWEKWQNGDEINEKTIHTVKRPK